MAPGRWLGQLSPSTMLSGWSTVTASSALAVSTESQRGYGCRFRFEASMFATVEVTVPESIVEGLATQAVPARLAQSVTQYLGHRRVEARVATGQLGLGEPRGYRLRILLESPTIPTRRR